MNKNSPLFEIHIHADLILQDKTTYEAVEEALRPLWAYLGAKNLASVAQPREDEPGIAHVRRENLLNICWTVEAHEDFRHALEEMCLGINDIVAEGAVIEVSFYDADFDDDESEEEEEPRDDFTLLFVGPTPAHIMQVQRNILVEHVSAMMGEYFDVESLGGVVEEIDKLFVQRFENLVQSLQMGKKPPPRPSSATPRGSRKPRYPH